MESGGKPWTPLFHQIPKLINTKVIISEIRKTAGVSSNGSLATPTEVVMSAMKERALERCDGLTALSIVAPGIKVSNMASESCCSPVVIEDADCLCKIYSKKKLE
jgi:hypothetical protein